MIYNSLGRNKQKMNHQVLDDIYFQQTSGGTLSYSGAGDLDINNFNVTNIKRLILDGELNDEKNVSFIVPTLTNTREITIPDANLEINKAEHISGNTLNSSVVNSNIQKLGNMMENLNMNNYAIDNINRLTSDNTSHNYSYGKDANVSLTTGTNNNAIGYNANAFNGTGSFNTAIGNAALLYNSNSFNTGIGAQTLHSLENASNNTAIGFNAGYTNYNITNAVNNNTLLGSYALIDNIPNSGLTNTVALGYSAGTGLKTDSYDLIIGSGDKNNQLIQGSFNSSNRHFSPASDSTIDLGQKKQRWKTTYSDKIRVNKYRPSYNIADLWAIYDFSDNSRLGYDYSGNKRDISSFGVIYMPTHTYTISAVDYTKDNVIYFNQTSDNQDFNQRLDFNNVFEEIKTNFNLSFSFWIYPTTSSANKTLISFSNSANTTSKINFGISATTNKLYVNSTETTATITVNNYSHIVYQIGTSGIKIYLNNSLVLTINDVIEFSTSDFNNLTFGAYKAINTGTSPTSYYQLPLTNAYIQSLSVWNKVLTADEITNLYNNDYGSEVVVLFGQSNMCGRGVLVAGIDDITNTRINQYPFSVNVNSFGEATGSTISIAQNPLDHQSTDATNTMGLWYTFCTTILPYIGLRRKILLIPAAWSGMGFVGGEFQRTGLGYIGMKNAVNKVLSLNSWHKLNSFLMHQGEADSGSSWKYYKYLTDFISNITEDIGMNTDIPYIYGTIKEESAGKILTNKVLRSFENEDESRYLVELSSFETNADGIHFNNVALREAGKLYGQKWLKHYFGSSFDSVVFTNNQITNNVLSTTREYRQVIYNSAIILFNTTASAPVYMNVSITLPVGIWALSYCLSAGVLPSASTYIYLSTSTPAETVAANIRNTTLINSVTQCKNVGTVGQDYRPASIYLILNVTSQVTYYMWAHSNTGTGGTGWYLFNPDATGGVNNPDNSIILNAVYLGAV